MRGILVGSGIVTDGLERLESAQAIPAYCHVGFAFFWGQMIKLARINKIYFLFWGQYTWSGSVRFSAGESLMSSLSCSIIVSAHASLGPDINIYSLH